MNHETLFNLLLPHLSVDVVYRLYPFSKDLRRMVDNRNYWRKLIERDLKMVPQFEVNPKLHYLRLMNYPVGGWLMKRCLNKQTMSYVYKKRYPHKARQLIDEVILFSNNIILLYNKHIHIKESIKVVRKVCNIYYAISYSGKVYNLSSLHPEISIHTFGENISDLSEMSTAKIGVNIYTTIVLTNQGGLKLITTDSTHENILKSTNLSNQLDSKVMQLHKQYVLTIKGTVYIINPRYSNNIYKYDKHQILHPSPLFREHRVSIGTKFLQDDIDILSKEKSRNTYQHLFIDPIAGYLLGDGFTFDLGDRAILEICDTRSSRIILRTL